MRGKKRFERWALAAGVVYWLAAWWRRLEPLPEPADEPPFEDAALAAGDFEIELTRARRAPRTRRLATTMAFIVLFCAGAAFTAGAGNVVAHVTQPTADAADEAAPAPEPAPAEAAPAEPAPAPAPAEPAPAPAPAPEPAPAPAAAPEPAPAAAPAPAPCA